MFYKEIEIYDSLLSKDGILPETNKNTDEIQRLSHENKKLRKEIAGLYSKLGKSTNISEKEVSKIISSISLEANNIKQAIVTNISIEKRDLELKIGKKSFYYSLINSPGIPKIGDECLAFIDAGVINNLFFYKNRPTPFEISIGRVLWVENNFLKIRSENRVEWVIEGKNPEERELISTLKRNDTIILEIFKTSIIRFKKIVTPKKFTIANEIYEELATKEIKNEQDNSAEGT